MRAAIAAVGAVVLALVLAVRMDGLAGEATTDLGVHDGRLKAPSLTRNSVSSQTHLYPGHPQAAYAFITPLPWRKGDPELSMTVLQDTLLEMPDLTLIERQTDYLRWEARTPWLRFVDDLEFWVDPVRRVIDVRSASRLGREDFGVNRKRVETIRMRYLSHPVPVAPPFSSRP